MADQCYVLEDIGHLDDAFAMRRDATLSEVGTLSERLTITRGADLSDVGTLDEALDGIRTFAFGDVGTLTEQYLPLGAPAAMLREVAHLRELYTPLRFVMLSDVGTLGEAWAPSRITTLKDTATFGEQYAPLRSPVARLADTGRWREAWTGIRSLMLSDTATLSEGWTVRRGVSLADTATVAETWSPLRQPQGALSDRATFGELWTVQRQPMAMLADEAFPTETWMLPATGLRSSAAWTANTDTWAMSRYSADWGITDVALVDGVLLGAGAGGLYRLDADTFAGSPISAQFTTGLDALGDDSSKHMRMVYAGARVSRVDALQVTVHDVTNGRVALHTYPFEDRAGDDIAAQRAKIGRGMKSVRWQFTIGNRNGADFSIESTSVLPDMGSRRV